MAQFIVRNLEDDVKARLKRRCATQAQHGRRNPAYFARRGEKTK
jgi:plasmid stability protein